jgi:hypothetical protein
LTGSFWGNILPDKAWWEQWKGIITDCHKVMSNIGWRKHGCKAVNGGLVDGVWMQAGQGCQMFIQASLGWFANTALFCAHKTLLAQIMDNRDRLVKIAHPHAQDK